MSPDQARRAHINLILLPISASANFDTVQGIRRLGQLRWDGNPPRCVFGLGLGLIGCGGDWEK